MTKPKDHIPIRVPHAISEPYAIHGEQALEFVTLLTRHSKKFHPRLRIEGDEIAIDAP